MESIATKSVTRYGTSSLSKAVAYHVKIIHDHHTGTKSPRKRNIPPRFGSSCSPRARATTATTKHRSKKSSSQVEVLLLARLRQPCAIDQHRRPPVGNVRTT